MPSLSPIALTILIFAIACTVSLFTVILLMRMSEPEEPHYGPAADDSVECHVTEAAVEPTLESECKEEKRITEAKHNAEIRAISFNDQFPRKVTDADIDYWNISNFEKNDFKSIYCAGAGDFPLDDISVGIHEIREMFKSAQFDSTCSRGVSASFLATVKYIHGQMTFRQLRIHHPLLFKIYRELLKGESKKCYFEIRMLYNEGISFAIRERKLQLQ